MISSHLTLTPSRTMSMLTLHHIQHIHSGNYTCRAPNAEPDTTQLFVTQRKKLFFFFSLILKRKRKQTDNNVCLSPPPPLLFTQRGEKKKKLCNFHYLVTFVDFVWGRCLQSQFLAVSTFLLAIGSAKGQAPTIESFAYAKIVMSLTYVETCAISRESFFKQLNTILLFFL